VEAYYFAFADFLGTRERLWPLLIQKKKRKKERGARASYEPVKARLHPRIHPGGPIKPTKINKYRKREKKKEAATRWTRHIGRVEGP